MAAITNPALQQLVTPPFRSNDLDISLDIVTELVLRRTLVDETTSIRKLSLTLAISPLIIEEVFESLRARKLLDVHGLAGTDYSFSLADIGRKQAQDRFQQCRYSGIAPVTLRRYWEVTLAQRPQMMIDRATMNRSFGDLVVSSDVVDLLGPAMLSNSSILMYGPSGTGKTSLAERLIRVYDDFVLIPYAIEADGQIVTVFDPAVHHALPDQPSGLDGRWLACKRPIVTVGGELSFDMLQLSHDRQSGVYGAPLQMKANNGIFLIDDFGRQRMAPEDLLNRWIIPLDRRLDYLALNHGVQFAIPFEQIVVFSTNLDPRELGDEAFLRRIHNKVFIGPVSDIEFDEILRRVATAIGIRMEPGAAEYMRHLCLTMGSGDLRPCYPRDLCRLLRSVCEYDGSEAVMSAGNLDRSARLYFSTTQERATAFMTSPPAGVGVANPAPSTPDVAPAGAPATPPPSPPTLAVVTPLATTGAPPAEATPAAAHSPAAPPVPPVPPVPRAAPTAHPATTGGPGAGRDGGSDPAGLPTGGVQPLPRSDAPAVVEAPPALVARRDWRRSEPEQTPLSGGWFRSNAADDRAETQPAPGPAAPSGARPYGMEPGLPDPNLAPPAPPAPPSPASDGENRPPYPPPPPFAT